MRKFENIRKIVASKGHEYTNDCLLEYPYFKDEYKLISIDLSKQQALDADPKAMQQINFIDQEIQNCFPFLWKQKKLL